MDWTRRQFLMDVGKGALLASIGRRAGAELGIGIEVRAQDGADDALRFGAREPLVCLLQDTPLDQLLPLLVERLRHGTALGELVAATALANARTFGGEDYVGFHSMMALMPALRMAEELPESQRPLPVLKVLYRNFARIGEVGGRKKEVLRRPPRATASGPTATPRDAIRAKDLGAAERSLLAVPADQLLEPVVDALLDHSEVHRVVLTYRAWDLLPVVGQDNAHTLLRQALHYFALQESAAGPTGGTKPEVMAGIRALLPKLLDEHHLHDQPPGTRRGDDAWIAATSRTILEVPSDQAAGLIAQALAEGFALASIHEALALAANELVRRDATPRAHGATNGVHASDTVHAWGAFARAVSPRQAPLCAILSAWHIGSERGNPPQDKFKGGAHPKAEALVAVTAKEPTALLQELDDAIRHGDQARACATAWRYGELGHPEGPAFALLLRHATSEDGKLHAEKYYRTTREEFAAARPALRWQHVVGLARFLASAYGEPAAGYAEACKLLKA